MFDLIDDWQYVLNFWFGESADDAEVAAQKSKLWWGKSPENDQLIWAKFSHRVDQASSGSLLHWLEHPEGRLAAIILLDQFRRNIYRNKPEAFAEDELARRWCREGLELSADRMLRPIERVFFYLPLEHSEDVNDQRDSVRLFAELSKEVGDNSPVFAGFLDYAKRHSDVIEQFGRFPHRNEILGRASTEEELAFLKEPGSSF